MRGFVSFSKVNVIAQLESDQSCAFLLTKIDSALCMYNLFV